MLWTHLDTTGGKTTDYLRRVGARCGASFIDKSFRTWLQSKLGAIRYQELEPKTAERAIGLHTTITEGMQTVMDEFEGIKQEFNGDRQNYRLLSVQGVSLSEWVNFSLDGCVYSWTTCSKDLQAMFDPQVDHALELLNDQFIQARDEGANVRVRNYYKRSLRC